MFSSADVMTCYWEVKIEAFTGVRLEIGVATRRSIRRGGLDKDEVPVCIVEGPVLSSRNFVPTCFRHVFDKGKVHNIYEFRDLVGRGPLERSSRAKWTVYCA